MSVVTSSLKSLSGFLQDHQVSFSNGLLILFTIGGEQIFRFNAFRCPCSQPDASVYAIIFMLVPAIVLGIMGVVVSNLTWRVCHGCYRRSKGSEHGFLKGSEHLVVVLARAAIVPCAWLFVTLLDGNYYACMMSSKPCERDSEEYVKLMAESQNISWCSLLVVVVIAFLVICIVRCCDSVTYMQYKYINSYRESEQKQFDKITQAYADDLAKNNVGGFIQKPQLKKQDWDVIAKASDHIISQEDGSSGPFFTPLHKWTNSELTEMVRADKQQEQMSEV